jgi:Zn-dependent M28 family amino/carboxypeptidase
MFARRSIDRTLRFVEFVNEEPPHFQTSHMGSRVYANRAFSRQEKIVAMLSLETIGYFSDQPGSQKYPFPMNLIYPDRGNFIAFVGNVDSRDLVRTLVGAFRRTTPFPSDGAALPEYTTGVGWSDHEPFWNQGYPAVMVTDTALFRYPHYHRPSDTPDKIDFDRLARVTLGLGRVVEQLVGRPNP